MHSRQFSKHAGQSSLRMSRDTAWVYGHKRIRNDLILLPSHLPSHRGSDGPSADLRLEFFPCLGFWVQPGIFQIWKACHFSASLSGNNIPSRSQKGLVASFDRRVGDPLNILIKKNKIKEKNQLMPLL